MSNKPFKRNYPPPPVKPIMHLMYYGFFAPKIRRAKKRGTAVDFLNMMGSKMVNMAHSPKTFAKYQPTQSDVFVCAYHKSGTNWTMQIAHQIANNGEAEFDHIYEVVPWPEMSMPGFSIPLNHPGPQSASPSGLRVIKSHMQAAHVPINDKAKYIVVIRDPKDMFVSSYFFVRDSAFGKDMASVDDWLENFLGPTFMMGGNWPEHTASFWALRNDPNILVLSFKEMKADLEGVIKRIAEMMEVTLTAEHLARVVEKSSFGYMKNIDHKFNPGNVFPGGTGKGKLVRSGKHGSSGELISLEQQKRIDAWCQAELKRLGSDFPYAEFCEIA